MRAHAFALELRSGGRDHVLHGEAELLLQLLQRRRRTERLHADARALGPDVTIPPEPARLLHRYPSRDVGRNHAVPIGLRLLLEQLPRRHADDAGPHARGAEPLVRLDAQDRKSTRLNSSHGYISYAVFCLKKKKKPTPAPTCLDRV